MEVVQKLIPATGYSTKVYPVLFVRVNISYRSHSTNGHRYERLTELSGTGRSWGVSREYSMSYLTQTSPWIDSNSSFLPFFSIFFVSLHFNPQRGCDIRLEPVRVQYRRRGKDTGGYQALTQYSAKRPGIFFFSFRWFCAVEFSPIALLKSMAKIHVALV